MKIARAPGDESDAAKIQAQGLSQPFGGCGVGRKAGFAYVIPGLDWPRRCERLSAGYQ
jgi:hypothetical protein